MKKENSIKSYRLIPGTGLGDALLFLPVAWLLAEQGHKVILHSHWLKPLEHRLEKIKIASSFHFDTTVEDFSLEPNDICYVQTKSPVAVFLKEFPSIKIVGKDRFRSKTQAIEIFESIFGSSKALKKTLTSLRACLFQNSDKRHSRKIAIHPGSHSENKNWPLKKYLKIANQLKADGWKIEIYGSLEELPKLKIFEGTADIYAGLPLLALMQKLSECTLFLGNDSGLGHLASLAKTPTISLFQSPTHSKLWRPSWCQSVVVTPWLPLPGFLRKCLWKSQLHVWQVFSSLHKLHSSLSKQSEPS